jgi:hypothetical protein
LPALKLSFSGCSNVEVPVFKTTGLIIYNLTFYFLGRVLRGSVELPLAGVHFFPMRTNKGPLPLALREFKHINKHMYVRMGKKCTPLPRRTVP